MCLLHFDVHFVSREANSQGTSSTLKCSFASFVEAGDLLSEHFTGEFVEWNGTSSFMDSASWGSTDRREVQVIRTSETILSEAALLFLLAYRRPLLLTMPSLDHQRKWE